MGPDRFKTNQGRAILAGFEVACDRSVTERRSRAAVIYIEAGSLFSCAFFIPIKQVADLHEIVLVIKSVNMEFGLRLL